MKRLFSVKFATVFFLIFSLSLVFLFLSRKELRGDSTHYHLLAKNLYKGRGISFSGQGILSLSEDGLVIPTMEREPGYVLLWSLCMAIFGDHSRFGEAAGYDSAIYFLIFMQIIMHFITSILAYFICLELWSECKVANLALFSVALFPTLLNYAIIPLTETSFTFFLALSVYLLIKAIKKDVLAFYFISGITMGIATLIKAITFYFPGFFAILYLCFVIAKKRRILRNSLNMLVLNLAFLMILCPWFVRNHKVFGTYSLTSRTGASLYFRADKVNYTKQELFMYLVYSFSEHLADTMFPGKHVRDWGDNYFKRNVITLYNEYVVKQNLTYEVYENILEKEAKGYIRKHPIKFLVLGSLELIKLNAFLIPQLNYYKGFLFVIIKGVYKMFGYMIVLLSVLGAYLSRRILCARLAPLFAVILYTNLIYFLVETSGRYSVPIIPLYIILASLPVCYWRRTIKVKEMKWLD